MTRPYKAKAPALVRRGFAKTVSPAFTDALHSTGLNAGRKSSMHDVCPVCCRRSYLGKCLVLSPDCGAVKAAVCDSCHAAVNLSEGFGISVAHRLCQRQQHASVTGVSL